MKQFFIKISLISIIVIISDITIGGVMDYVVDHITVGGRGRDNYICNKCVDDILVFGSSRAVHHYNSKMLEDSLRMSCYNCGEDGNGIFLSYGRLLMIKERHCPSVIIYDYVPVFDLELNDNNQYLGWLKNRYKREGIDQIIDDINRLEKYKLKSGMYRHNSVFLQNLATYFTSISNDTGVKGFRPLKGEIDEMKIKNESVKQEAEVAKDPLKSKYLYMFKEASKGARLIFVVSPIWYGMKSSEKQYIKDFCEENNLEFIDFSNNPKYVHNNLYFKDGAHLNEYGANEFTKDLISLLRL